MPRQPVERRRVARRDDLPADRGAVPVQTGDQRRGGSGREPIWLAADVVVGAPMSLLSRHGPTGGWSARFRSLGNLVGGDGGNSKRKIYMCNRLRSQERGVGRESVSTCRYRW